MGGGRTGVGDLCRGSKRRSDAAARRTRGRTRHWPPREPWRRRDRRRRRWPEGRSSSPSESPSGRSCGRIRRCRSATGSRAAARSAPHGSTEPDGKTGYWAPRREPPRWLRPAILRDRPAPATGKHPAASPATTPTAPTEPPSYPWDPTDLRILASKLHFHNSMLVELCRRLRRVKLQSRDGGERWVWGGAGAWGVRRTCVAGVRQAFKRCVESDNGQ